MLKSLSKKLAKTVSLATAVLCTYSAPLKAEPKPKPVKLTVSDILGSEFLLFEQGTHTLATCVKTSSNLYRCTSKNPEGKNDYELKAYPSNSDLILRYDEDDCTYSGSLRGNIIKGSYKCEAMPRLKEFRILRAGNAE